ncbi:winged helix-turn-helix domain-containing protein [Jatrophihabitans sp. GAS493]|uniref:winged helix-turn-helix domain-containing protein n=1 Tax=Jatrophihabitans sp. GAS493 TaxID=1907575 RepID=UPI0012FD2E03|nr:winged helix-turn-helix domain-containing protein [Jatrophihabitans sp. GAS493]
MTARERPWLDSPDATLRTYILTLRRYVAEVLESVYPRFEARVVAEAAYLTDLVHRADIDTNLLGLHPDLVIRNGAVRLPSSTVDEERTQCPVILLTPMICSAATFTFNGVGDDDTGGVQMIGFATQALQVTGPSPATPRPDPLATLLGDARARILRALFVPATTTELANDLNYSPSTVSHHLKALTKAGAIENHRSHWFVYYRLTDIGRQLLLLYS